MCNFIANGIGPLMLAFLFSSGLLIFTILLESEGGRQIQELAAVSIFFGVCTILWSVLGLLFC